MADLGYTTNEMMAVAAARMLDNGTVCFVGIGLPSQAANLARLTHAPEVVLIYESGPIGAKPDVLPLSIGDGILAESADTVVPTHGPSAGLLVEALATIDIPAIEVTESDHIVWELVRKNLYILTANIGGLVSGGSVHSGEGLFDR